MVGEEHHPGGGVRSGLGELVEQFADRGVRHRDRSVEIGEVLAHVRPVSGGKPGTTTAWLGGG